MYDLTMRYRGDLVHSTKDAELKFTACDLDFDLQAFTTLAEKCPYFHNVMMDWLDTIEGREFLKEYFNGMSKEELLEELDK